MVQWGLWDEAGGDLRALVALPLPTSSMASSIAAAYRLGAERMVLAGGDGAKVLDEALSLPPGPVRDELLAVLLWPHVRQATKAALRGRVRSDEAQVLRSYGRRLQVGALLRLGRIGAARVSVGLLQRAGLRRADHDASER